MKLCDEVITVFNAHWSEELGDEAYCPTVIRGASWHATQAETVDPKGGLIAADRVIVRIPVYANTSGKAYVDVVAYRDAADVSGLWTLTGGTIIVRGEAEGDTWTPAELRKRFADCVTVLGVTDNRRAPNGRHWKAVGA